jgi:hypothetical protein
MIMRNYLEHLKPTVSLILLAVNLSTSQAHLSRLHDWFLLVMHNVCPVIPSFDCFWRRWVLRRLPSQCEIFCLPWHRHLGNGTRNLGFTSHSKWLA